MFKKMNSAFIYSLLVISLTSLFSLASAEARELEFKVAKQRITASTTLEYLLYKIKVLPLDDLKDIIQKRADSFCTNLQPRWDRASTWTAPVGQGGKNSKGQANAAIPIPLDNGKTLLFARQHVFSTITCQVDDLID